jgi:hypothetical protein
MPALEQQQQAKKPNATTTKNTNACARKPPLRAPLTWPRPNTVDYGGLQLSKDDHDD